MRETTLNDKQRIVKVFVVWTVGLGEGIMRTGVAALLFFGSSCVPLGSGTGVTKPS